MRAQGQSYAKCAEELGTSKRTLLTWAKDLEVEISNFKAVALEALYEEFFISREARVRILGAQLKSVKQELESRDLEGVATSVLLTSFLRLVEALKAEEIPLEFETPIPEDETETERFKREAGLVTLLP